MRTRTSGLSESTGPARSGLLRRSAIGGSDPPVAEHRTVRIQPCVLWFHTASWDSRRRRPLRPWRAVAGVPGVV